MTNFQFGVLGPLEVRVNGAAVAVTAAKHRVVLTALLLNANRVVPAERLAEFVWDDEMPGDARHTVQIYVMRLRRLLGGSPGGGPLLTRPPGYLLEVGAEALDLERFMELAQQGRDAVTGGDIARGADLLRQALGLWRGEPLSDVPSDALQREAVPVLREKRLNAVQLRVEADLALGRHAEVLPELQELVAQHPLRERLWAQQMRALYRSGRQAEALESYRTIRELLVEQLGVDPGQEIQEVHKQVLTADPALAPAAPETPPPRVQAPPGGRSVPTDVSSFVGRDAELAAGRKALRTARLVTLTGVGGVGKTRLAIRLAADVEPEYPDGVCLVDLAATTEPGHLERTVTAAAGIYDQSMRPGTQVLVANLRDRRFMLVLDNCEHLVGAVADLVATLLSAIPGLQVLATSRQALGLVGEHLLTVTPLAVPTSDDARRAEAQRGDSAPLAHYDAVRLLADRAASSSDIDVLRADPRTVVELCQRLEGIPLAIELAAIRLTALSVREVLDRLDDRFRLLSGAGARITPSYHQTLQAVIDWSHDLCTGAEQRLWARLSVFAGEFDLDAAEAVCSGDGIAREGVMDLIAGLVGKSIVSALNHGARTRYRLLETIRQYGQQQLLDCSEYLLLRYRHRDYYMNMAEQAAADWCSPREAWWMDRLHQELPNLRSALDFSIGEPGQAHAALEMVHNLARARCWWFSGTLGEGRQWIERTLALRASPPGESHAAAQAQAAWIALCQGDATAARTMLDDAKAAADHLGRLPVLMFVEGNYAALARTDPAGIALLARAKDEYLRRGQTGEHHMATLVWSVAVALFSDADDAYAATGEFLALATAQGTRWGYAFALWARGVAEMRHGQPRHAVDLFREALHQQSPTHDHWGPTWLVEALAWAAAADGDHQRAAWLLGTAHQMRRLTGLTITGLRTLHQRHIQARQHVQQCLGAAGFDAAHQQGAAAPTYQDALTLAIRSG